MVVETMSTEEQNFGVKELILVMWDSSAIIVNPHQKIFTDK